MGETKRVTVELQVWTTCHVYVNPEPDDDGMYDVDRILVPTIEGFTRSIAATELPEEMLPLIDEAAAKP